jgi:hypothetical protein
MMPFNGMPEMDDGHGEVMNRIGEYLSTLGEIDNLSATEYDLFYIGEYNTDTGKFEQLEERQHIANCVEFTSAYEKECSQECDTCKTPVNYLLEVKRKFLYMNWKPDDFVKDVTFIDCDEFVNELIYICRGCYMEVIDGGTVVSRKRNHGDVQQDSKNEEESMQL